jgi:glycosyltransferase involved in cell wall biosynthesis
MLIGIDANEANLTPNRVGVNQYAFDLLWEISKTKSSHEFLIYLKSQPLPDMPKMNYRVIPFPKFWTQTRLPWDLLTHFPRPDVFFSMTHYAPRVSPVPTVVSIMDLGFLQTPEQFTKKDFKQLKDWTEYSVKQAKKIIAISEYTKKDITREYGRKPEDIIVTPLSYDKKLFRPTKNIKVLEKYGIKRDYILFLSSLKPSKNIEGLIRSFSMLDAQNYQLVIAGKKGWLFDKIFTLVKTLKLDDRVIFTGFVDEEDVPVLMTHAGAFVMPSFYEGFGIPVLEAMACGTPVVVSKIASLPEVAGNAGIYIDPYNNSSIMEGIKTAIGPERSRWVKLGLERVKMFDWEKTAQITIKCLETATTSR